MAFCEIEDFPRKVLAKHWPEVPQYEDVTKLTGDILKRDGISVDVITGGFPCQDISVAGKRAGIGKGTRSGLWSEIVRLIGELRPRYVIVENVSALLSGPTEQRGGWFGRILGDLAECGYNAEWDVFRGIDFGLPQERPRVAIVAYPNKNGDAAKLGLGYREQEARRSEVRNTKEGRPLLRKRFWPHVEFRSERVVERGWRDGVQRSWPSSPLVVGVGDGLPDWVDRRAACGNAVVPQIPEMIGRAILQAESERSNG